MVLRSLFGGFVTVVAMVGVAAPAPAAHQEGNVSLQVTKRLPISGTPTTAIGSVTSSPAGISCGADCTETYALEDDCQFVGDFEGNHGPRFSQQCDTIYPEVSLSAPTGAGYTFQSWGGACSGTGGCSPFVDGDPTVVTATFTDTGSPVVTPTAPANGAVVGGMVNWTATASDNDQVQRVRFFVREVLWGIDDTAPYGGAFFDSTMVPDGSAVLRDEALDRSGNQASASRTVIIDNTSPTVSWNGPPEYVNDPTPTFTFSGSDANGPSFQCRTDGGVYGACTVAPFRRGTGGYTTPALADGPHSVSVRASDPAGNLAVAGHGFTVDTIDPETEITRGPSGRTQDRTPKFRFTGTDANGITFDCRLDEKPFKDCDSPKAYNRNLSFGRHTFQVFATDVAGNVDDTVASRKFKIVR